MKRRGFSNIDTILARNIKGKRFLTEKKEAGGWERGGDFSWAERRERQTEFYGSAKPQKSFALLASRTTGISSKATERK